MNYTIELIDRNNLDIIIPLLKILNPSTDETVLQGRLEEMKLHPYHCIGVYDGEKLIGICGFWLLVKHYVGKHIEPDNVLIIPGYQGKKIGELMLQWIYEYGRQNGCVASEINCYVGNSAGVKFWINQGFKIIGYHFQKHL
ncbi:MAG TPA: GNAT family N-acetyltransferase [Pedobacter sp.]|jgi:GNAT superfamily N-acetyltransferase